VTRALILRLFDSLGFSRNREPMKATAGRVLELRDHLTDLGFDETAALLFGLSGIPAGRLEKIGRSFMPESRLPFVLPVGMPQLGPVGWDYNVRPANAPERRLWGGAKLLFDIIRRRLLEQAHDELRHGRSVTRLRSMFHVKLGSETLLGNSRADDIVVNALLPVALAAGLLRNDFRLVAGSCLTYRNWPSLASNRIVREVERRFADGADIAGAFFQQGAIEYYQRVLSPDRSGYSMIAEKPGTEKERNGI